MTSAHEESRSIHILVVEDDVSIRRLIALALPRLETPYKVVCVGSAEEGLQEWSVASFDLLLTDHNLPGMRGTELITRLRDQGATVPIIMFTAYDSPRLGREAQKLGVAAYVPKPFLMEDLLDTIREVLGADFSASGKAPL